VAPHERIAHVLSTGAMTLLRCGGRATEGSASARSWIQVGSSLRQSGRRRRARLTAYDWWVLTEGADERVPESDEVVPGVDPVDPLSAVDPSSQTLEPPSICELSDWDAPVLEDDGDELEDEAAALFLALALALPELDALRAGSWPLASVAKMTLQVAMNRATVSATALRRMRRTRDRLAARRGLTAAADMGDTLGGDPKPSLSAL
jgi:hypothetical protein